MYEVFILVLDFTIYYLSSYLLWILQQILPSSIIEIITLL